MNTQDTQPAVKIELKLCDLRGHPKIKRSWYCSCCKNEISLQEGNCGNEGMNHENKSNPETSQQKRGK